MNEGNSHVFRVTHMKHNIFCQSGRKRGFFFFLLTGFLCCRVMVSVVLRIQIANKSSPAGLCFYEFGDFLIVFDVIVMLLLFGCK